MTIGNWPSNWIFVVQLGGQVRTGMGFHLGQVTRPMEGHVQHLPFKFPRVHPPRGTRHGQEQARESPQGRAVRGQADHPPSFARFAVEAGNGVGQVEEHPGKRPRGRVGREAIPVGTGGGGDEGLTRADPLGGSVLGEGSPTVEGVLDGQEGGGGVATSAKSIPLVAMAVGFRGQPD